MYKDGKSRATWVVRNESIKRSPFDAAASRPGSAGAGSRTGRGASRDPSGHEAALANPARRWVPRHTYGAIDLGTNNCRLLVARPTEDGFTVIDAFSRVVRLGEGICLEIIAPEEEARLAMLGCHRLLEPGDGPALIFDIGGGSTELVLIDTDQGEPRIKCWWSAPWGVVSLTESEGRHFATTEERLAAYGRMRERVRHAFRHFVDLLPASKRDIRLMGTSGTVTTLASV